MPASKNLQKKCCSILDNVLEDYFGDSRLSDCLGNVAVVSYRIDIGEPQIRFSHGIKEHSPDNCLLCDAAGASSSAPTYFTPKRILDGSQYTKEIDGGIFLNNPEFLGIKRAMSIYDIKNYNQLDILSIGTGSIEESVNPKNYGSLGWAPCIADAIIDANSEFASDAMNTIFNHRDRLQFRLDRNIDLDDATDKNLSYLLRVVDRYIKDNPEAIDKICNRLTDPNHSNTSNELT